MDRIPIEFDSNGKHFPGWLNPLDSRVPPRVFHVILNNLFVGTLSLEEAGWTLQGTALPELGRSFDEYLENFLQAWYQ